MQQKRNRVVPHIQTKARNTISLRADDEKAKTPQNLPSTAVVSRDNSQSNTQSNSVEAEKDLEKNNQLSSPEPVHSITDQTIDRDELRKSFSEKIVQYLSTKMKKVVPDPEDHENNQQLQIIQAGGSFINTQQEIACANNIVANEISEV